MRTVKTLHLSDPVLITTRRKISDVEQSLFVLKNKIKSQTKDILYFGNQAFINEFILRQLKGKRAASLKGIDVLTLKERIKNTVSLIRSDKRNAVYTKEKNDTATYSIKDKTRFLNNLKADEKRLSALEKGENDITFLSVVEALSKNNKILPETIRLAMDINDNNYIMFSFKNLQCTPSHNKYLNIMDRSFLLREIRISVNITDRIFRVTPVISEMDLCVTGYSGKRVHPHILSNDTPCLGDFLGAIVDAIDARDWNTLGGVFQTFLEQAYDRDAAGAKWPRWAIRRARDNSSVSNLQPLSFKAGEVYGSPIGGMKYNIPVVTGGKSEDFIGNSGQCEEFIRVFLKGEEPIMFKPKKSRGSAKRVFIDLESETPQEISLPSPIINNVI